MAISDRDAYIITRVLESFAFLALGIFFGWSFTRRRYVRELARQVAEGTRIMMVLLPPVYQAEDFAEAQAPLPEGPGRVRP